MERSVRRAIGRILLAASVIFTAAVATSLTPLDTAQAATHNTIIATPAIAIPKELVAFKGTLATHVARAIVLQRRSGARWVTAASGRATARGRYSVRTHAPAATAYYRVVAKAASIAGKSYPPVTTSQRRLVVRAQSGSFTVPEVAPSTTRPHAKVASAPARAGRPVALQQLVATTWTTLATGTTGRTGAADIVFTADIEGTNAYRVKVGAFHGAPAYVMATVAMLVTGPPGSISGQVTAGGQPVAGVAVSAGSVSDPSAGQATTAADGTYRMDGLSPGSWAVCFTPPAGYVEQCYPDVPTTSATGPDLVTVTSLNLTSGIDAALGSAGQISGTVTDDQDLPVAQVSVTATATDGSQSASATTTSDGSYHVGNLPAGSYSVCFTPAPAKGNELAHDAQCWNDQDAVGTADPVAVAAGSTVTSIDAHLATAAGISGSVTDGSTGDPVSGASIAASLISDPTVQYLGLSRADGSYTLSGLGSGDYQVCFYPPMPSTEDAEQPTAECYDRLPVGSAATPVTASAGSMTDGIDATLSVTGAISGAVTLGGAPLGDVEVQAVPSSGAGVQQTTTTAADGTYHLDGLATGDWTVCFYPATPDAFAQCWNTIDPLTGTPDPVTVSPGIATAGIDADLTQAGSVSGLVSGASTPLAGARVELTRTDTGGTSYVETDADGSFTATGLAPADYTVCAFADGPAPYSSTCLDAPVTVAAGQLTSGADITLTPAATIGGTVTEAVTGTPLAGVEVDAFPLGDGTDQQTATRPDGTYDLVGLAAGDYIVCFFPDPGHQPLCYPDQPADGTGSPSTVTAAPDAPSTDVDATLQAGG